MLGGQFSQLGSVQLGGLVGGPNPDADYVIEVRADIGTIRVRQDDATIAIRPDNETVEP